jgi:tetratricopeptide (TPR) repeat protein
MRSVNTNVFFQFSYQRIRKLYGDFILLLCIFILQNIFCFSELGAEDAERENVVNNAIITDFEALKAMAGELAYIPEKRKESLQLYNELISRNKTDPYLRLDLAALLFRIHRLDDALREIQYIEKNFLKSDTYKNERELKDKSIKLKGDIYLDLGYYQQAASQYKEVMSSELFVNDPLYLQAYGRTVFLLGDYSRADDFLKKAFLKTTSQRVQSEILKERGDIALSEKKTDLKEKTKRAFELYKRSYQIDNKNIESLCQYQSIFYTDFKPFIHPTEKILEEEEYLIKCIFSSKTRIDRLNPYLLTLSQMDNDTVLREIVDKIVLNKKIKLNSLLTISEILLFSDKFSIAVSVLQKALTQYGINTVEHRSIELKLASLYGKVGLTAQAESIYNKYLLKNPLDQNVLLLRFDLLNSLERWYEAEAILNQLIAYEIKVLQKSDDMQKKVQIQKVLSLELKKLEIIIQKGDIPRAENEISTITKKAADTEEKSDIRESIVYLTGKIALQNKNRTDALKYFEKLTSSIRYSSDALLHIGKIYIDNSDEIRAQESFERAMKQNKNNIESKFFALGYYKPERPISIEELFLHDNNLSVKNGVHTSNENNISFDTALKQGPHSVCRTTIDDIFTLTDLLVKHNRKKDAAELVRVFFYKSSSKFQRGSSFDPFEYQYRFIRYAEYLLAAEEFDAASELFQLLNSEYPDNRKTLLGLARSYLWSKNFLILKDRAGKIFDTLLLSYSEDEVVLREAIRFKVFSRKFQEAEHIFREHLTPSLTAMIQEEGVSLKSEQVPRSGNEQLYIYKKNWFSDTKITPVKNVVHYFNEDQKIEAESYDQFYTTVSQGRTEGSEYTKMLYYPAYHYQKALLYELQGRKAVLQGFSIEAEEKFKSFLQIEPWSRDIQFECAQAKCRRGNRDEALKAYYSIMHDDKKNELALEAVENFERSLKTRVGTQMSYSREEGRGELSHNRTLSYGIQVKENIGETNRNAVSTNPFLVGTFGLNRVMERPFGSESVQASEIYAKVSTNALEDISISGMSSFRTYDASDKYDPVFTGTLNFDWNIKDTTIFSSSLYRQNELHNRFGLLQDIQSDTLSASLQQYINNAFSTLFSVSGSLFNDSNSSYYILGRMNYRLTDFPEVFTLFASLSYRDTDKESIEQRNANNEVFNIVHPYWSPQNFYEGKIGVSFNHDLTDSYVCEAPRHFYTLESYLKDESGSNPGFNIDAKWFYDTGSAIVWEAKAGMHRSVLWDSDYIYSSLHYIF